MPLSDPSLSAASPASSCVAVVALARSRTSVNWSADAVGDAAGLDVAAADAPGVAAGPADASWVAAGPAVPVLCPGDGVAVVGVEAQPARAIARIRTAPQRARAPVGPAGRCLSTTRSPLLA